MTITTFFKLLFSVSNKNIDPVTCNLAGAATAFHGHSATLATLCTFVFERHVEHTKRFLNTAFIIAVAQGHIALVQQLINFDIGATACPHILTQKPKQLKPTTCTPTLKTSFAQ